MSVADSLYLTGVIAAFLIFAATLFAAAFYARAGDRRASRAKVAHLPVGDAHAAWRGQTRARRI